jgi:hypothetical protein
MEQVRPTDKQTRSWQLPASVACVSAVVFLPARPHLVDDTFITLAYARNLAFHGRGTAGRRDVELRDVTDYAFFDFDVHPRQPDLLLRRLASPPPDALAHWTIEAPTLGRQELYSVPS